MTTPAQQGESEAASNITATSDTAAEPAHAPASSDPATPSAKAGGRSMRLRAVAMGAALVGIIFGGTIEYFVGGFLDSTGWFGPTLDTVVEQQSANFDEIRAKLDALSRAEPGSPEAQQLQSEIGELVNRQEKLTSRTHEELRSYETQLTQLKADALARSGAAKGVDFWLKAGEGITVGEDGNVLALERIFRDYVYVNASGRRQTMRPGDVVEFPSSKGAYRVIFKDATATDDGRIGFDMVPPQQ